jgi:hypothetical protein
VRSARRLAILAFFTIAWTSAPAGAGAQQPFFTDDAEVGPPGVWHVELSSQIDWLRPSAHPLAWQHLFENEVDLGLPGRLEVSGIVPVLTLAGDPAAGPRWTGGLADSGIGVKARFTESGDRRHALAGSVMVEFPTGDRARGLGSGLIDYTLNLITQHAVAPRWLVILNGGVLLAGDSSTGAVGIQQRGTIVNAGGSVRHIARDGVQLGAEVTMSWSEKATFGGTVVGVQVGANVPVARGCTLDIGGGTGWFQGSPRASFQVGVSVDLNPDRPFWNAAGRSTNSLKGRAAGRRIGW